MTQTSKGAKALRSITEPALTRRGAKWTPETGWTDGVVRKEFKVAILSTNTNSFGLQHAVLIAKDGEAFEAYPSKYGSSPATQGQVVRVKVNPNTGYTDYSSTGWEMCRQVDDAPRKVIKLVWK